MAHAIAGSGWYSSAEGQFRTLAQWLRDVEADGVDWRAIYQEIVSDPVAVHRRPPSEEEMAKLIRGMNVSPAGGKRTR
jgi:hypothetical protein